MARRLRLRFGLKWLLLAVPLVAIVSIYASRVSTRRSVEGFVAKLSPNAASDLVEYDFQFDDDGMPSDDASAVPEWLLDALGPSYFHDIVGVTLDGENISVKDLSQLSALRNLQRLDLEGNQVDPASFRAISRFRELRRLDLQDTGVSDSDLEAISGLVHLRWLMLSGEQLTDEGLRNLAQLLHLEGLSVRYSSVTGAGLKHLACERTLRKLDLYKSPIDPSALPDLLRFTALEVLDIEGSDLSDADIERLVALERLKSLRLPATASAATVDLLRSRLPACEVCWKFRVYRPEE